MLEIVVCVSGGGTNLQALIDAVEDGRVANVRIKGVISNNRNARALERAGRHGISSCCISPKDYESRELFNEAFLRQMISWNPDLIVLAGFLVAIPEQMVREFADRIINIHPSLIPSFCGVGYYGLKVHEAVLKRGVKVTGARIISQKAVSVEEGDTPEILQRRVMEQAEWILLPEAVHGIADGRIAYGGKRRQAE